MVSLQIFFDMWDISKNLIPITKYGKVDGAVGDTDKNVIKNRIQGMMYWGKIPKVSLLFFIFLCFDVPLF